MDLDAEPGEVIGLIGPNGAGKSTTLRALAGLVVDQPRARSSSTGAPVRRRHACPEPRAQRRLRLPGPSAVPASDRARQRRLRTTCARDVSRARLAMRPATGWTRLDVSAYADRKPAQLSGGQAQRVAIARALGDRPGDAAARRADRRARRGGRDDACGPSCAQHLHEFAGISIIVTHTALDAMLHRRPAGRASTAARSCRPALPADVAAHPRTEHVAALVGLNLVRGEADRGRRPAPTPTLTIVAAERLSGPAFAAFSPSAVSVYTARARRAARATSGAGRCVARLRMATSCDCRSTSAARCSPTSLPPPWPISASRKAARSGSASRQPRSRSIPPDLSGCRQPKRD